MTTPVVIGHLKQRPVPVVAARRRGNLLIIDDCPLCGQRHEHGAGPQRSSARSFVTHRIAHCVSTHRRPIDPDAIGRGYYLAVVAQPKPATTRVIFWNGTAIGEVPVTPPPRTAPGTASSVRFHRFKARPDVAASE